MSSQRLSKYLYFLLFFGMRSDFFFQCSAECFGVGVHSRHVFCGETDDSLNPTTVAVVDDEKCDSKSKLTTEEECESEEECVQGEWFTGPYSKVTLIFDLNFIYTYSIYTQ